MSKLQPAPQAYNANSEQQLRNELDARDLKTLKTDRAVDRILVTDSVTGETGYLTVASGVPTWTAL